MTAGGYVLGDGFRLEATFTVNDVATDPTAIVFKLKDPDDIVTTYTFGVDAAVVRTGVGVYYLDVTVSKAQTWYYRVVGTGTVIAATEGSFAGIVSQFP